MYLGLTTVMDTLGSVFSLTAVSSMALYSLGLESFGWKKLFWKKREMLRGDLASSRMGSSSTIRRVLKILGATPGLQTHAVNVRKCLHSYQLTE